MPAKIERRYFTSEVRVEEGDDGAKRLAGYSAVFGRDSVDLGGFTEEIAPGAFTNTLKDDDVRALIDHDSSRILGRSSAKTLRLAEDKTGLRMEVDLPDTTNGRDIAESVSRGDVTGQSFSFRVIEDEWNTKGEMAHRTLKEVRLFDVGPVTFPAYPDTSVAMRSLEQWKDDNVPPEVADRDALVRQEAAELDLKSV